MNQMTQREVLLRIKECDLRMDCLWQCDTSVDRGLHVGGAFSALTAMTALYYGGIMQYDVEHPTNSNQDIFVLSKGHAVAALASVYADVGYISRDALSHSRGFGALIKGHPGPIVPGVAVATGPLGHGISISCGYAIYRSQFGANVYCMVGDGELQEGSCWEGAALAADRGLANLCVIVDKNHGQSDNTKRLLVTMDDVAEKFRGFGFRVLEADCREMEGVVRAFERFKQQRNDRPTAIICNSSKGFGGHSAITQSHKATMSPQQIAEEMACQEAERRRLVELLKTVDTPAIDHLAAAMKMQIIRTEAGVIQECRRVLEPPRVKRAPVRDKKLQYSTENLPRLERDKTYNTFQIAKQTMRAFASDARLFTIDSDLSNASGLYDGTSETSKKQAINVGIAECNMMCVAEALASEGGNVWTSTFPPFFDQRAMRRIAVSYQEREEAIAQNDGWLSDGHNLDITFMATSANLETAVNGATHMGNDDMNQANQIAKLKVIDVGCPQMLLAVMRWIAEGNRGLVYLRTMKSPEAPLYAADFTFRYGKAYRVVQHPDPQAILVSSGHGVYEAVRASRLLEEQGVAADVIDMPSFDPAMAETLAACGRPVLFAEQNNGAIADMFSKYLMRAGIAYQPALIRLINTTKEDGSLQFIQSGTYQQLLEAFHLTPQALADTVLHMI